jgi:hypothetical protein
MLTKVTLKKEGKSTLIYNRRDSILHLEMQSRTFCALVSLYQSLSHYFTDKLTKQIHLNRYTKYLR